MCSTIHRGLLKVIPASLLAVLGLIVAIGSLHAEIKLEEKSNGSTVIELHGTISQTDAEELAQNANRFLFGPPPQIFLNSTGGDVDAAMRIGRLIRSVDGITYSADKCYGSCALIFIAGVSRFNLGTIGLRRPHSAPSPQGREPAEQQAALELPKLKAYVQEMGETDRFYQEMVNADASSMKLYSRKAIEEIVPEKDPVHDDIETSYEARGYGVDPAEMRRREKETEKCDERDLEEMSACSQALKWGLSVRLYYKRRGKIPHCSLTEDEKRTLSLQQRVAKRDHPLILKQEACIRSVMLSPDPIPRPRRRPDDLPDLRPTGSLKSAVVR
jgi:hypothetical protein